MRIPSLTLLLQSPVSIATVPSHDSFMDIPALEQELLNSSMAPSSTQIEQSYVDSYFTSSDSNEDLRRSTASAPGSPNSPASPGNTPIQQHQIPQIKLEHTPSFVELTAAASLSPSTSGRRSVRKVRRTTKEMSNSDDDDERREKVKNSEKKRRDRLRYG